VAAVRLERHPASNAVTAFTFESVLAGLENPGRLELRLDFLSRTTGAAVEGAWEPAWRGNRSRTFAAALGIDTIRVLVRDPAGPAPVTLTEHSLEPGASFGVEGVRDAPAAEPGL
jgi:hypothetical protein